MTEAFTQKPSVHRPPHAPATAVDVRRPASATIEPRDHVAAAAYLMRHAGVTADRHHARYPRNHRRLTPLRRNARFPMPAVNGRSAAAAAHRRVAGRPTSSHDERIR